MTFSRKESVFEIYDNIEHLYYITYILHLYYIYGMVMLVL